MIMYEMTSEDKSGFDRDGYLIVRSLFDKQEMSGLLKFAEGDETMASDAYVRRDADGGETRLAVRNELDDALPYTAVVRSARIVRTMESFRLGDTLSIRIGHIDHEKREANFIFLNKIASADGNDDSKPPEPSRTSKGMGKGKSGKRKGPTRGGGKKRGNPQGKRRR
jgi:hypothetical protein